LFSVKFRTDFDHVTSDVLQMFKVIGSKVKATTEVTMAKMRKFAQLSITQPQIAQFRSDLLMTT